MKKLCFIIIILLLASACEDLPSKVERDNPNDPKANYDDEPPIVDFKISPKSGLKNETIFRYDASNSREAELPGTPLYFTWDYDGDGNWNSGPHKSGIIDRKILKSGYITPRVYVQGGKGLYTIDSQTVYVYEKPIADFAWKFDESSQFYFDAYLSIDFEGTTALEYRWDFQSDGIWDTEFSDNSKTDYHSQNDIIEVTLEIKDWRGLKSSIKKQVFKFEKFDVLAQYLFNGDAKDEGKFGFDGVVIGASLVQDRMGNENSAFHFDGINDFIDIGNHTELEPQNNFAISFWVKFDKLDLPIFTNNYEPNSTSYGYYMESNSDRGLNFNIGGVHVWTPEKSITLHVWYHIICNYPERPYPNIYINGNLRRGQGYNDRNPIIYNDGPFNFGRVSNVYFHGTLDDIYIFDRPLSYKEIDMLYHILN